MNFNDRLKELRNKAGLTQEKLAIKLDIPESTIRRLESSSDASLPRRDRLERIADFFGVSVDYLLGRVSDPSTSLDEGNELDDPELGLWFKELSDEARNEAKRFIKFLMEEEKNRKQGDKQGG